ncbi:hypothetical protein AVEN_76958-1 [Araneus ventricosus]|uniref:Uncharacterized protein n=1 Tax=Araneus ventricosus TaxID=182803 RepID=A0A4Y2WL61_ARAVE|nr:hypothetical protein AVEN_76958-1 [Araneus ventricosus]
MIRNRGRRQRRGLLIGRSGVRDPVLSAIRPAYELYIRRAWGPLHAKLYVVVKHPPDGVVRKFGEVVPAKVSSSDRSSKLRGASQDIPRVASKRGGRSGLVVRSRPRDRRVAGSKSDSTEDPQSMGPAARQIIRRGQMSSRWCGVEVWRRGASSGVVLVI